MNNEQAIIELRDLISDDNTDRENEALLLAIEKLREQPTDEWCTDCKEYDHEKNCCPRFNKVIRETLKDAQPTAKWVHREEMDFIDENHVLHQHFMCQNCEFIHDFIDGHTSQYKFCPQCGTMLKMKGGDDNDL